MRGSLGLVVLLLGCSTTPSGTVHGVHYEASGPADATRLEPSDHEHVWVPAESDMPTISMRVESAPSGGVTRCQPSADYETVRGPLVGSDGQTYVGESVRVVLCSAEHPDEVVVCSVYGTLPLAPIVAGPYAAICHGMHVR